MRIFPSSRQNPDGAPRTVPATSGLALLRAKRLRARLMATGLIAAGLMAVGCETTPQSDATANSNNGATAAVASNARPGTTATPTAAERLEATLVIGPAAARELGYRIAWESENLTSRGGDLAQVHWTGDAVFTLDTRNLLCRVRIDDGARVWASPVASAADRVFGITRIDGHLGDRLHLTTESAIWVVDAITGVPLDRHNLARSANTASTLMDGRLIYATRAGQIVWHDPVVGHPWRVRQVDGAIRHAPVAVGVEVAVVSGAGNVMVMRAETAEVLWRKELLAGVTAAPTGGRDVLFVAGLDQYLWSFDLLSGRTLWKNLNDAPLTTSPVLLGDRLFQRLPNAGLVCFDAYPGEAPDGRRLWTNAEVRGEVIGRKGRNLLVWDPSARRMSVLEAQRGAVVMTVDLPNVDGLKLTDPVDGELLAFNRDGRLIRLVPR